MIRVEHVAGPSGEAVGAIDGLELVGLSSIEFRQGRHGGLRLAAQGRRGFDGDRTQWETRARLLDPLARSAEGFQYLDDEAAGGLIAVVTTHPHGGF